MKHSTGIQASSTSVLVFSTVEHSTQKQRKLIPNISVEHSKKITIFNHLSLWSSKGKQILHLCKHRSLWNTASETGVLQLCNHLCGTQQRQTGVLHLCCETRVLHLFNQFTLWNTAEWNTSVTTNFQTDQSSKLSTLVTLTALYI